VIQHRSLQSPRGRPVAFALVVILSLSDDPG